MLGPRPSPVLSGLRCISARLSVLKRLMAKAPFLACGSHGPMSPAMNLDFTRLKLGVFGDLLTAYKLQPLDFFLFALQFT